jgi:hypothetical protein
MKRSQPRILPERLEKSRADPRKFFQEVRSHPGKQAANHGFVFAGTGIKSKAMKTLQPFVGFLVILAADYYYIGFFSAHANGKGDLTGLYAITGLIILFNLIAFAFFVQTVLANAKGTIEISCEDRIYEGGDEIRGELSLHLNHQLEVEGLRLTLIAEHADNGNKRANPKYACKDERLLAPKGLMRPGRHTYQFAFTVPKLKRMQAKSVAEKLVTEAASGSLSWRLSADLETAGVDITNSKKIRVNDGDLFV